MARKFGHKKDFKFKTPPSDQYIAADMREMLSHGASINIAYGGRSDGKSTFAIQNIIERYVNGIGTGIFFRRLDADFAAWRKLKIFDDFNQEDNTWISEATNGEYDRVSNIGQRIFFAKIVEKNGEMKTVRAPEPFCYVLSISSMESTKGVQISTTATIVFDEFMTRKGYLPGEIALFFNSIATFKRRREVQVFLIGNSVSIDSAYFEALGVDNPFDPEVRGRIVVRKSTDKNGDEYNALCTLYNEKKNSDGSDVSDSRLFGLINTKSAAMITTGEVEMATYQTCPVDFSNDTDVKYQAWVFLPEYWVTNADGEDELKQQVLRMRVIKRDDDKFLFIESHDNRNVFDRRAMKKDTIYKIAQSHKKRHYVNPMRAYGTKSTSVIAKMFALDKVFFSDNIAGEKFRNYMQRAKQYTIINLDT